MATVLFSPSTDREPSPRDHHTNGGGRRGTDVPIDPRHDTVQREPERRAVPESAYRLITLLAIVWITALFATLTIVLKLRWVHSQDWVSIKLPQTFYANTAALLLSSISIELARRSLQAKRGRSWTRWTFLSLWMGFLFLGGQAFAWRELSLAGLHLASNPGSFFLFLMTGTHALCLLGGMAVLTYLSVLIHQATQTFNRQVAMNSIALYWQFMDVLWLCLVLLLFVTIQR